MKIWEKIVILRPVWNSNAVLEINDSKEAARVLLMAWPADRGKSYRRAVLSCSAAIDGRAPHDAAQWAFIVAVMEAAIPYEIIDRLDAEIGAVCRALLRDERPDHQTPSASRTAAPAPVFWWPRRSDAPELEKRGGLEARATQGRR